MMMGKGNNSGEGKTRMIKSVTCAKPHKGNDVRAGQGRGS